MIPDFMGAEFNFTENSQMVWRFKPGGCFAYKGISRLGVIGEYQYGLLFRIRGWLKAQGIRHTFRLETGKCAMHFQGECWGTIDFHF